MKSVHGKYTFVEKPNADYMAIRLTEADKYGTFIYKYGKIQFGPQTDEEKIRVTFDWSIIENSIPLTNEILDSNEFVNFLGDILVDIVEHSLMEQREGEFAMVTPKSYTGV
jgi:hypothetical protein